MNRTAEARRMRFIVLEDDWLTSVLERRRANSEDEGVEGREIAATVASDDKGRATEQ